VYKRGDYIICSYGGVWQVDKVDDHICLNEHASGNASTVSVHHNDILRSVASRKEILEVIDRIGLIRTIQAPNNKIRREFYQEALAQYDKGEWGKVIKSAYLRKQERRLTHGETEYADKAKAFFTMKYPSCWEFR